MPPDSRLDSAAPLPALPSAFIGRAETVRGLLAAVARTRLLTLTGVGGVGKTRLAIETARTLSRAEDVEVAFVDLAPLRDPLQVVPAAAAALAVREEPGREPLASIVAALGERRVILLLDNCEHLLDASAALAGALIAACPRLNILATSRERLRIDGEHVYEVAPLELPDAMPDSAAALAESEAGALFLDRARARRADLPLTADDVAAVAQICRRLDGLPLALELAAARTGLLSPRQIADRLDDRFRLLVGGRRDAPARQQTLHATLDWSYDLLVSEEQAAFRALAVFPADFELGAATAICAVGDATLDLLDRLVETSLVRTVDQGGQRRFRLLETLRAYGREKLAEVGETPTALQRHAEHFLLVAEAASERSSSVTDTRWLNWLRQERTNLIAAVAWFCDSEQPAEALRLLNASFRVWSFYGGAVEGDRWLQRLWPRLGVVPVAVRSRSIYIAAFLAREVGDLERAHRLLEPVDALFREVGDDDGLAAALNLRAILAYESGDDEGARLGHEQGLAQARARGDRRVEALHLTNLALAQLALERFDEARASATAALEISRQCADEFAVAVCLANLGGIAYGTDDLERAVALYRQARLAAERIGYSRLLAVLDDRLSHCERRFGDLGASAALLRHSLATSVETDAHTGIAEAATSAAILAVDAGRLTDAALLWALAADLLERLRASVVSIYRADFARTEQVVLADAGAADLSRLRASAHQTSWDDAARAIGASLDALHEAVGETTATAALRQPARDSAASPLTEREREVLRLLAAGRSNKEIAAALVLSVRTVERHIENIYAKTGAHGRAAATQFALSHAIR